MVIERLKAISVKPARVVTPQCCMVIPSNTRFDVWRRERYAKLYPDRSAEHCRRESVVKIDGKPYCRMHAGGVALDRWLKGDLVAKVVVCVAVLIVYAQSAMADRSPAAKPMPGWYEPTAGAPPIYFRPFVRGKVESTRDIILRMQRPGRRDRLE